MSRRKVYWLLTCSTVNCYSMCCFSTNQLYHNSQCFLLGACLRMGSFSLQIYLHKRRSPWWWMVSMCHCRRRLNTHWILILWQRNHKILRWRPGWSRELFHDKEYLGLVRLREVMKDLAAMVWRQVTVNILNFDFLPVEMQNKWFLYVCHLVSHHFYNSSI